MPVKYFVSKDSRGKEQPPDFSHEVTAIIEIIKQLYAAFNHHKNLYVIVANLNKQDAMADMVILTERGIGIVELKGYPGQITMRGTEWYAGLKAIPGKPTIAGKSAGYRNPHEQVQLYMDAIRYKLLHPASEPWLPGKYADWVEFQFGTAVCFTHEDVSLIVFLSGITKNRRRTIISKIGSSFRFSHLIKFSDGYLHYASKLLKALWINMKPIG